MNAAQSGRRTEPAGRTGSAYVTGLFRDAEQAQVGFDRLVKASFDPHAISLVRVDEHAQSVESVPVEHTSGVPTGITTGVALGGTVGLASAVVGGPIGLLAAGPILAALQGAFLGATGGGLLGALAGLAFWRDEPELEAELRRGAVFVGVTAEGERARAAREALRSAGATRLFG